MRFVRLDDEPPFVVHRQPELAAVDELLARASSAPAALTLQGPAGIGKTTLWLAGCRRAAPRRLLVCRPAAAESDVSYLALVDLLGDVSGDELAFLPVPQRAALEAAVLRAPAGMAPTDERAVAAGLLGVLQLLASRGPLLLAIDDVQWLDPSTARALQTALRRLGSGPIGVLATCRTDGAPPLLRPEALLDGSALPVGPLDVDGLGEIVTRKLGRLPLPLLADLHRACEGNPFLGLEMARTLMEGTRRLEPGEPFPVPKTLSAVAEDRLRHLPLESRRAAEVVSLAARPTLGLVSAVLGDEVAAKGVDTAVALDVLEARGQRLAFTHPLLAAAVGAAVPPGRARALHRELAAAVADVEQRTRHLALSAEGADATVADALEEAAGLALRRGAPVAAAELLELAIRHTPPACAEDVARRAAATAEASLTAGDLGRAHALLQEVLPTLPASARAPVLAVLGDVVCLLHGVPDALPLWLQAIDEASDPALEARVHQTVAWDLAASSRLHDGAHHAAEALRLAEEANEPAQLAGALATAAVLSFMRGQGRQPQLLDRAFTVLAAASGARPAMPPTLARAIQAVWGDEFDVAHANLDRLSRDAEDRGDQLALAHSRWYRTQVLLRQGRWRDAREESRLHERLSAQLGTPGDAAPRIWLKCLVESTLGDVDAARKHASAGLALADPFSSVQIRAVLGFVELSLGDAGTAFAYLQPLPDEMRRLGYDEPGFFRFAPDVVEAALAVGAVADAASAADWLRSASAVTGNRWSAAAGERCLGLIAASARDSDRAAAHLERAVALHEPLGQPFELARTLLIAGTLHRRLKHRAQGRALLERARDLFGSLPAPLWQAKVDNELARMGELRNHSAALTPTEQRIAQLIAAGRSNRETADALFCSVKTVEWNLSRIYRKLGVRSRTELAARWQRLEPS